MAALSTLALPLALPLPVLAVTFPVAMIAYLLIPGLLIQIAVFRIAVISLSCLLYSFGLSLSFWILGPLALNTLLPVLGLHNPLSVVTLSLFYIASVVALCIIAHFTSYASAITFPVSRLTSVDTGILIIAVFFPFLSIAGSTTLNNSGSGAITIALLVIIAVVIVFVSLKHGRVSSATYPIVLIAMTVSLLLMFSMRSWHVLGFDVHNELRVFETTLANKRWLMSYYPHQPYNACLSITILPTALAGLLHIPPEYIYKLVYPIILSITSLLVYSVARQVLSPALSFFAGVLCVSQVWYFEQLPSLARQEIALVFFCLLILCVVDVSVHKARRVTHTYVFIVCLVVSHYSTAYVWLLVVGGAVTLRYVTAVVAKRGRAVGSNVSVWMVLATILVMLVWQGPITQSSNHATTILATNMTQLTDAFSPKVIRDGLRTLLSAMPSPNTDANLRAAYESALQNRRAVPEGYYPPGTYFGYSPRAVADLTLAPNYLPRVLGAALRRSALLLKDIVTGLLSAVGICVLAAVYRRRTWRSRRDLSFLSASAFCWMVAVILSPYIQENYNLPRLYIQLFMVLAIPSIVGLWFVVKRHPRYGIVIAGVAIAIIFVYSTGLLDQVAGGPLRITMTQPRGSLSTFYVYDTEVAAAKWIAGNRDVRVPVLADSVASLRLESYADIDSVGDVFPATIPRESYVYLIRANVDRRDAFVIYTNLPLVYGYPTPFLDSNKDLIYNDGQAKIYK